MQIVKAAGRDICLDSFLRKQQVSRVYVMEHGCCVMKDQAWVMDWSLERKREVARELTSDGCSAYLALDGDRIAGFVSVLREPVEQRMILDIIQVDAGYRRQGLGRKLFALALEEARARGAKSLYISACCSVETVDFYRAMGAEVTQRPIRDLAEAEPWDIQMEYIF